MIMQGISPLRRRQRSFPLAPLGTLSHSGDNQKFLIGGGSILFGKVSDFPAKQSPPLFLLVSIPPNWANDAKTRKKVDKKQKNTRKTLDIAY
jgi:hypothetical protein